MSRDFILLEHIGHSSHEFTQPSVAALQGTEGVLNTILSRHWGISCLREQMNPDPEALSVEPGK